jgi:hypothetical protein
VAIETLISFVGLILFMMFMIVWINVAAIQLRIHYALTQSANEIAFYTHALEIVGVTDLLRNIDARGRTTHQQVDGLMGNAFEAWDAISDTIDEAQRMGLQGILRDFAGRDDLSHYEAERVRLNNEILHRQGQLPAVAVEIARLQGLQREHQSEMDRYQRLINTCNCVWGVRLIRRCSNCRNKDNNIAWRNFHQAWRNHYRDVAIPAQQAIRTRLNNEITSLTVQRNNLPSTESILQAHSQRALNNAEQAMDTLQHWGDNPMEFFQGLMWLGINEGTRHGLNALFGYVIAPSFFWRYMGTPRAERGEIRIAPVRAYDIEFVWWDFGVDNFREGLSSVGSQGASFLGTRYEDNVPYADIITFSARYYMDLGPLFPFRDMPVVQQVQTRAWVGDGARFDRELGRRLTATQLNRTVAP